MTPRFLHTNRLDLSSAVISATSFQPGYPPTNVRDQDRKRGWRSMVGWTITPGVNDRLDFTEGGVARVATITPSTYASGTSLAAVIQGAMNTAPGVTNLYTVTYDVVNLRFNISKASGPDTFILTLTISAPNYARSVHRDLGYDDVDKLGGGNGVIGIHQSRQALMLDLGAAISVNASGVVEADDPIADTQVLLQGSDSSFVGVGMLATPAIQHALTGSKVRVAHFAPVSHRYWRLLIDATDQPAGFTEVGCWALGTYAEPARKLGVGIRRHFEGLSAVAFAKGGAHVLDQQPRRLVLALNWTSVQEADRAVFETIAAACPVGKCLFLTVDPADVPGSTLYGFLRQDLAMAHRPLMSWDIGLEFAEAL